MQEMSFPEACCWPAQMVTTAVDRVTGGLQRGQMAAVALPSRRSARPEPKREPCSGRSQQYGGENDLPETHFDPWSSFSFNKRWKTRWSVAKWAFELLGVAGAWQNKSPYFNLHNGYFFSVWNGFILRISALNLLLWLGITTWCLFWLSGGSACDTATASCDLQIQVTIWWHDPLHSLIRLILSHLCAEKTKHNNNKKKKKNAWIQRELHRTKLSHEPESSAHLRTLRPSESSVCPPPPPNRGNPTCNKTKSVRDSPESRLTPWVGGS